MGDINSSHCYNLCDIPFACCDGSGGVSLTHITTINGGAPGDGGFPVSPGAPFNSVQWNNNGTFAGDPQFLWDTTAAHLNISADGNPGLYIAEAFNSRSGALFADQVGYQLVAGPNTALYLYSPIGIEATTRGQITFSADSPSGYAYAFGTGASNDALVIMPNNAVGINLLPGPPAYMLDVNGDVNSTACYRINGVPFACPDGAGGINITNVTNINGQPPGSGGGGTPAPPDRAVQFNNGGAFGGTFNLVYSTTGNLGIGTSNPEVSVHANGGILSMNSPITWPDSGPGIMMFVDPSNNGANGSAIYSYNFGPNTAIDLNIYARNLIGNVTTSSFSGRMGIGKAPGASFALDVNGNITTNHCYYMLNFPFACLDGAGTGVDLTNINSINGTAPGGGGASQTPWLSDIDGGNHALTNVQYINANGSISGNIFSINGISFAAAGTGPATVGLQNILTINGNPYPPPGTPQTPWLSTIDAANFTLINASQIGFFTTSMGTDAIRVQTPATSTVAAAINLNSGLTNAGSSSVRIWAAGNSSITLGCYGPGNSTTDKCNISLGNTDLHIIGSSVAITVQGAGRSQSYVGIGFNAQNPAYQLDVAGDVNCTGVYRINGVPLSTGGGGGFWQAGSGSAIYYGGPVLIGNNSSPSTSIFLNIYGGTGNQINVAASDNNSYGILIGSDPAAQSPVVYHGPSYAYVVNTLNAPLILGSNNAPRVTVAANGNFGIGIMSPVWVLDCHSPSNATCNLSSDAGQYSQYLSSVYSGSSALLGGYFVGYSARGTPATPTTILSGDVTANFGGYGYDSSAYFFGASIAIAATANYTATSHTTAIIFNTTSGTGTLTERMRISGVGNVGLGFTSANAPAMQTGFNLAAARNCVWWESTTNQNFRCFHDGSVTGLTFNYNGGGSLLTIVNNGRIGLGIGNNAPANLLNLLTDDAAKPATNTWTVTSDIRTKQNVQRFESDWGIINALDPIVAEYNGYANTPYGARVVGFAAQELQGILPQCVTAAPTRMDDGSEENILGVNTHEIFFHMLRAIQDLNRRLERFENL